MPRATCPTCAAWIPVVVLGSEHTMEIMKEMHMRCQHPDGAGSCPHAEKAADKLAASNSQGRHRPWLD